MAIAPDIEPVADAPLVGFESELRADAAHRLNHALLRMERFLSREENQCLDADDPTRRAGRMLVEEGRCLLRGALRPDGLPAAESTLRTAYRLIGTLSQLAAWSAPASQESWALNSYPVAASRDVVAYARYGCAETACQEEAYLETLGFDASHARLLLTSSGMAAYSLIENFLLRDVLAPADRVLLHPGVYFETQAQVRSLPFLDVHMVEGMSRQDVIDGIVRHRPAVVFVDPLTNTAELRLLDLARLLNEADAVCRRDTWFVIDGTLLSGGFDAFARRRRHVRVLYYESGCKYLQFGMDLGPAGLVIVAPELAERFERLRRGIGAVAAESLVLPRASRRAYLAFLRAQTRSAAAVAAAVTTFGRRSGAEAVRAVFPTLAMHPDAAAAKVYPHLGGVVTFRFLDPELNCRSSVQAFIDELLSMARARHLPLTAGVSFGFCIPRISAAWSSYDQQTAFLRLSAGIAAERADELGTLIAQCAASAAWLPSEEAL